MVGLGMGLVDVACPKIGFDHLIHIFYFFICLWMIGYAQRGVEISETGKFLEDL